MYFYINLVFIQMMSNTGKKKVYLTQVNVCIYN